MDRKLYFFSFVFFLATSALGTTFYPTPVKDQISRASGVIIGTFESQSYKKLHTGEVVTEAFFNVDQQAGIEGNHLINPQSFRVMIPGGKWQGLVYHVHGTPKFNKGKKVALILSQNKFGYTLSNLAMSKFDVVKRGKKNYLISDVFSHRPGVGQVEFDKFEGFVNEQFSGGLKPVGKRSFVNKEVTHNQLYISNRSREGRAPASTRAKREPASGSGRVEIFWLVITLGVLGAAGTVRSKKD